MFVGFQTPFQNPDEYQNIIISCFGVELSAKTILSVYEINSFDNPFKFITNTLSVKNKTTYLIISASKSDCIIPLIHKHYCVEKIYLYGSRDTELFSSRSLMFEKISGYYEDMNELCKQIMNDIKITTERPLHGIRSSDFFTMLYTQRLENESSVIKSSNDVSIDEFIVIFHCDRSKILHIDQRTTPISEFTDANECVRIINEKSQSQIFLAISGSKIPSEIQPIFDLQQIHAIYLFSTTEINYLSNKRKACGLFNNEEDLAEQLYQDIAFYREQYIHTSRIDTCPIIEHTKQIISHLNHQQIVFLICNLFIDILPQVPLLEYKLEDFKKVYNILFPNEEAAITHYVDQLLEESSELKKFVENSKVSQIILRVHQLGQFK